MRYLKSKDIARNFHQGAEQVPRVAQIPGGGRGGAVSPWKLTFYKILGVSLRKLFPPAQQVGATDTVRPVSTDPLFPKRRPTGREGEYNYLNFYMLKFEPSMEFKKTSAAPHSSFVNSVLFQS